jgi:predicted metal-dependent HD superfamily phosphohydrolase
MSGRFARSMPGCRSEVYREKRADVLRGFLAREPIYRTPWVRERCEVRAKENLKTLIGLLSE